MKSARNIIASVDLLDSKVVRLKQGDYKRLTQYEVDPLTQLMRYVRDGSERVHIVDLEGARDPSRRQVDLIARLVRELPVPVQTGGGIRSESDIEALLNIGVEQVVIGSVAVKDPTSVCRWFKRFGGNRLILALDCKINDKKEAMVATDAWKDVSALTVEEMIERYKPLGLSHVLCTDVGKDGLLKGSNAQLYKHLTGLYPELKIQASGGIGSLEDIRALSDSNVDGIIIGRALLEGRFSVKEAIACWLNA